MKTSPGWYALPEDPTKEQYFNGAMWIGARQDRQEGTPDFAANAPASAAPSTAGAAGGLRAAGTILYVIAVLALIGTVVAGIALVAHKGQSCTPNPYSDAFGGDLEDCSATHPFRGAGWGVLAAGLVQTFVLFTVAYLCVTVDRMRHAS